MVLINDTQETTYMAQGQPSMEEAWTWKLNIINVNMLWYTTSQLTLYFLLNKYSRCFSVVLDLMTKHFKRVTVSKHSDKSYLIEVRLGGKFFWKNHDTLHTFVPCSLFVSLTKLVPSYGPMKFQQTCNACFFKTVTLISKSLLALLLLADF